MNQKLRDEQLTQFLVVSIIMRLLTHNHLQCIRRVCTAPYPLRLSATAVEKDTTQVNAKFIAHIIDRIDIAVLRDAGAQLGLTPLPADMTVQSVKAAANSYKATDDADMNDEDDDDADDANGTETAVAESSNESKGKSDTPATPGATDLISLLHSYLMDIHLIEGALTCGGCGRAYPVRQAIPNMRLNEDEV